MFNDSCLVMHNISKEEVLNKDYWRIGQTINLLSKGEEKVNNKLHLVFLGYDNDLRELVEIKEVSRFAKGLVKRYPHIFCYLSTTHYNSERLLLQLIADKVRVEKLGECKSVQAYLDEGNNNITTWGKVKISCDIASKKKHKLYGGILTYTKRYGDDSKGLQIISRLEQYLASNQN
jgi:hypothetical protein